MKRKKHIKEITRKDWQNEIQDEIVQFLDDIDTIGLTDEQLKGVEKYTNFLKLRLFNRAENFKVTVEIALQNDSLVEDIISEAYYERICLGEYEIEKMKDIVEQNINGKFVRTESLAADMRLNDFMASLNENPYQLQLIA